MQRLIIVAPSKVGETTLYEHMWTADLETWNLIRGACIYPMFESGRAQLEVLFGGNTLPLRYLLPFDVQMFESGYPLELWVYHEETNHVWGKFVIKG